MLSKLRFARLRNVHIFEQLRLEELLLRHDDSDSCWCLINSGPPAPTIITGLSGKVPELVDIDAAKRDNISVIRRFTGGGTVVVDENTFFVSFIGNSSQLGLMPYPRDIMSWTEKIYANAFANQQFCLKENDYVFGNHKIGGNAQAIVKDRFVHHTSFLYKFSNENMQYLQMPKKKPEYRSDRSHADFLKPLSEAYADMDDIESNIMKCLSAEFDVDHLDSVALGQETLRILGNRDIAELCRTKHVDF